MGEGGASMRQRKQVLREQTRRHLKRRCINGSVQSDRPQVKLLLLHAGGRSRWRHTIRIRTPVKPQMHAHSAPR